MATQQMQLIQLLAVPAIAGLICLFLPRARFIKEVLALIASGWAFYLSITLWSGGDFRVNLAKLSFADIPIRLDMVGSSLSLMVVLFVGLFGVLGALYSWKFRSGEKGNHLYYALLLWTIPASQIAILSDNLIVFVIFWEISTILLYGLINSGNLRKREAATGGYRTLAVLGFSEALLLMGVLIIWAVYGNISMSYLSIPTVGWMGVLLYLMFLSAALAKAGAIPLHAWIPVAADGAPTSIMAYLPASIDKLLGIYLLARITPLGKLPSLFQVTSGINLTLMIIGAATVIIAVMLALVQHNLKKLLSYHAISQIGYMVLGIGTGTPIGFIGGLFHMVNNAIYKSCLFFCAGSIEKRAKTTELDQLGGLARYMPLTFFSMFVAAMAISGVPPFNGFTSKWLVYQACIEARQPVMLIAAMVGSALTLASFIKVIYSVFFGTKPTILPEVKEASPSMTIPQLILAFLCIFFGIFAVFPVKTFLAPIIGLNISENIIGSLSFADTLWSPSLATAMMIIGIALGIIIYFIGKAFKPRKVNTYYGGEILNADDIHVPGTAFYETISKLPLLKTAYKDSEQGIWDPDNFVATIVDGVVVRGLKLMHSGNLSTYLSWSIIGLVIIVAALIW